METTPLALVPAQQGGAITYTDSASFEHVQRVAKMFAESALIPQVFQKNIPNTVIALEMANRIGASPLAVMQNLYIVHGKPSWASQFIIACINTCGRFEPLMFEMSGSGDEKQCVAWTMQRGVKLPQRSDGKQWTIDLAKAEGVAVLDGPPCSIAISKKEGWFSKNGSKWQTMPDLMLRYRAATFFGRIYAPELLMGMKAYEEVVDVDATVVPIKPAPEVRFPKQITHSQPEQVNAESTEGAAAQDPAPEPEPEPERRPAKKSREVKPADGEPATDKGDSATTPQPTHPETAAQEKPLPVQLDEYFRKEANADFVSVLATHRRLQPKKWNEVTATSYAELSEADQKIMWSGKAGTYREVKRDLAAAQGKA